MLPTYDRIAFWTFLTRVMSLRGIDSCPCLPAFFSRGATIVSACLFSWVNTPSKKWFTLMGKNLLLRSKFFHTRVDPIEEEGKTKNGRVASHES